LGNLKDIKQDKLSVFGFFQHILKNLKGKNIERPIIKAKPDYRSSEVEMKKRVDEALNKH
jgi:hypothetical protein